MMRVRGGEDGWGVHSLHMSVDIQHAAMHAVNRWLHVATNHSLISPLACPVGAGGPYRSRDVTLVDLVTLTPPLPPSLPSELCPHRTRSAVPRDRARSSIVTSLHTHVIATLALHPTTCASISLTTTTPPAQTTCHHQLSHPNSPQTQSPCRRRPRARASTAEPPAPQP